MAEYKIEIPFCYPIVRTYDDVQSYMISNFEKNNLSLNIQPNDNICNKIVIKTNIEGLIQIMRKSTLQEIQSKAKQFIDAGAFELPIVHALTSDLPKDSVITEELFEKYMMEIIDEIVEKRFQDAMQDFRDMDSY